MKPFSRLVATRLTGWSVGGAGAQAAFGAATTVLLARSLDPRDLGVFGVFLSIVFLCNALGDLGLGTTLVRIATPLLHDGSDVRRLTGSFLTVRLCAVGLAAASVLFLGEGASRRILLDTPHPDAVLRLAAAAAMAHAVGSHCAELLRARLLFRPHAVIRGAASALRLTAFALLAAAGSLDIHHALLVATGMLALHAAALFALAHRGKGLWPPRLSWPRREWLVLSGWVFVTVASTALLTHTDTLLLATLGGADATGNWVAAARLLGIVPLITTAVWGAVLPVSMALVEQEKIDRFLRLARRASVLAVVAGFLFLPAVDPAVRWILGKAYTAAVDPARWLLVAFAFQVGGILYGGLVHRLRLEKKLAGVSLILLAVNVAGDAMLIPRYGAAGCAAVTAGVMLAGTAWTMSRVEASRSRILESGGESGR